ncbi:MAG: hypothetical protein KJO39_06620 [Bacteroidia bacterium]|nr:hypothetical protein [Bacteroidia bacterium]NNF31109.1 hypothetical protein [Flavobacteriaceae bacterium]NNJ81312.1 hypothetical protein [Flavobacteriaceae bacterium]NNK55571.1 hypothetical protein [Flavobacteriaceae bacterium]NNM08861.1 hypothetical protein [Flavobacteriaceae bacterium]
MDASDKQFFELLKQAVAATYLKENHASASMEEWKGEEIVGFQEDLFQRTRGRVSEKWFYSYFKNEPTKLPRIDMLNLLCEYTGHEHWNAFKKLNLDAIKIQYKTKRNRKYLWLFLPVVPLLIALYYLVNPDNEFQFCMVSEDGGEPITAIQIDVKILSEGQSPIYLKTDSTGCFSYVTKEKIVRFVVQSPYHKTDTITRNFDANTNAMVLLATDDYALMLRYYSSGNVKELKKRRAQLSELIADNARIYQVFPDQTGIELYSKEEFITKLTIPTSSLKNINILDKHYEGDKIVKLKFSIQ